jgi:signal transduction histidine kinase
VPSTSTSATFGRSSRTGPSSPGSSSRSGAPGTGSGGIEPRPPRRGFGLRPRLLLALIATAAVTLGAAALALLNPLQNRLERQAEQSLRTAVITARPQLNDALRASHGQLNGEVLELALALYRRTGSRVILTDSAPTIPYPYDTGAGPDSPRDIYRVLATNETVTSTSAGGETRVATLLTLNDDNSRNDWVLAVRNPSEDVASTVAEVRSAFIRAAIIGLVVALLLGLALVGTLTARLERLRAAALRIAREGPGARPPRDERRDEVGDLARALATMQEALDRQERARRAFVATASHELRTPLTSLAGMLELLGEDVADRNIDREDALAQIALARGEVDRLTHLATDLLDLSRLDAETPMRAEPTELTEIARAVAAEFAQRAGEREVAMRVVPPPGACWARGDPGAVARTIRILLDNALRFAPPGTQVTLTPAYHGTHATLEVADEGVGVLPGDAERIFERFQRGRQSGGEGGFGLGLAIGRELAERQGGRLELRSAPGTPARGARFRLSLPIEPEGGDVLG